MTAQDDPESSPSTIVATAEELAAQLAGLLDPTSVIICVGDEMRGDDGAGPAAAKALVGTVSWPVIDAHNAPENFLMKVVEAEPRSVVLVDAIHFDESPGAVRLIEPKDLSGHGPSTHGPAPVTFLEVLNAMHPCRQVVLGIQPGGTELGSSISQPVKAGITLVIEAFRSAAARDATTPSSS